MCFKCGRIEGLCNCIRQHGGFEPTTSDRSEEQQSDFKCRLSCCKCSYCHRVATKERCKSQYLSIVHRNKICERCFLCRSLTFCKSCHQCSTCCFRSSCRGEVKPVLGEMGNPGFKSKSGNHSEGGLHTPLPVQTPLDKVTDCNKQLPQSSQTVLPFRDTVSADKQKCGGQSKFTGVLQPAIFGTQTQQPVETHPRPEHLEHLFKHRGVQDGDPRDHKNLPPSRGVGHIHRFQRCILPYTHSQSVQEVHAFSPPGSVLPVQSPSLWPVHSPHGVHSGGQRGQTHGTSKGYKDPPVPRRLAGESLYPRHLSPAYSKPSHTVPGARVAGEQGKIRTGPTAGLQLRRLSVQPEGGQGQTNRGTLADLDRQDQINTVGSGIPGPKIHVPHRPSHSNRKTSPLRATTHETHTVALEKLLEGPRITGKGDPGPQVPPPPSKVVAGGKQCAKRSTITPSKTCSANTCIYRCIKRRVGRSLRQAHCKGTVVPTREQVTHKPLGAESSISSSKRVSNPSLQQDSVGSYRQHNSGCLYQQRGWDEIGLSVCPTVENTVLVHQAASNPQGTSHPRPAERDRRQAIQAWPDHSNRVVTSSRSVPSCMLRVASATSGPVCHQVLPQFVSPVPDPQAWAVDALSLSWEDLDPYAFPPAAILGKVVEKLQDYPCNRIILIAPGWPNMSWFWDLVAMSSQIPLCLPSIPNLVSQPFNQVLHRNLSNLNLHAWLLEPQQSRSKASLRQWQHELRLLKEDQPDLSMRQSGPFLQSGASVIRWTSGHHL